jgi:uncharacterized protein (TIGR03435 family)
MARIAVVLVAVICSPILIAQQPVPAFQVASIRANTSTETRSSSSVQPGGRYTATNVTIRTLVKSAYGLQQDVQVAGGPRWIETERFDIVAKADGNPSTDVFRDQARMMLRTLLAERFKLSFHRETREVPIYALIVARADGKLGPQLLPSTLTECAEKTPPNNNASAPLPCGGGFARAGDLAGRAVAFTVLTANISNAADRPVVDRTGLTGTFDWRLRWTPEPLPRAEPLDSVTLFTALQEQLGLKLDSTRGPVEVLVIDSAERPTLD